jgi:hypothetical protein
MSKEKKPRFTTPKGTAQYPYLTKPDTKFNPEGEYKLKLELDAADAGELISFLDEQVELSVAAAKKDPKNAGKKIKVGDAPYSVNEETGKASFNFKLKAKVTTKSGETFEQRPAIFDAKGKPITDVNIGGGSKVKVAYEVVPFYTALVGASISLRMKAVQVIDLVEFSGGASAEGYGFGEEEGYEAEDNSAESNGFNSETEEDNKDF